MRSEANERTTSHRLSATKQAYYKAFFVLDGVKWSVREYTSRFTRTL